MLTPFPFLFCDVNCKERINIRALVSAGVFFLLCVYVCVCVCVRWCVCVCVGGVRVYMCMRVCLCACVRLCAYGRLYLCGSVRLVRKMNKIRFSLLATGLRSLVGQRDGGIAFWQAALQQS